MGDGFGGIQDIQLQIPTASTLDAPPFPAPVTHAGACASVSVTRGLGQLMCSYYFQLRACRKRGKSRLVCAQVFTELAVMP